MPADLNEYFKKNGVGGGGFDDKNGEKKDEKKRSGGGGFGGGGFELGGKLGKTLIVLVALVVLAVVARPFVVINSGEVGIKSTLGKFDPNPLQPGFHLFVPFFQEVRVVDTKVRIINYTSTEGRSERNYQGSGIEVKETISVLDSRGLPVSIDITVQYRLNPMNAPQTIATWGFSWESKIVDPVVRNVVRNVIGKYTAEELPEKRNDIAAGMESGIRADIDAQPNKPVELTSVQLREIILPAKVKEQIEQVQVARQEAERARYEVEKAKQEALKKAALAQGTADAVKIEAQGKADAVKIEADAQAYANKQVANSLTANLLELKQIQTQKEFNEALKVNNDAKIFLTPGGAVPNIWLDTKDAKKASSVAK